MYGPHEHRSDSANYWAQRRKPPGAHSQFRWFLTSEVRATLGLYAELLYRHSALFMAQYQ